MTFNVSSKSGIMALSIGAIGLVSSAIILPQLVENLDSAELMVIQSPFSGELSVYTEAGWHWQGMGKVTVYPRRNEYTFGDLNEKTKKCTSGLNIRFYDGGHANICGTVQWEMPLDEKSIINIHRTFRSAQAVESQAIARALESAAYFSGPTMSSLESAAGRRTELLQYITDQMVNGVYKTRAVTKEHTDESGNKREVTLTEIVLNAQGQPVRTQESFIKNFNIRLLPTTIKQFAYDDVVERQIIDQQKATNSVQVAIANARRAQQDAITTAAQGEANAAKAKWDQETVNAKIIAEAQQKVVTAEASVKEAEAYKKAQILRGEGDARAKELVMSADGALDKKLAVFKEINAKYAEAIAHAQPGAWAPQVVMGGNGGSAASNSSNLVDLLTAKTARDLGLDMSIPRGATPKKK